MGDDVAMVASGESELVVPDSPVMVEDEPAGVAPPSEVPVKTEEVRRKVVRRVPTRRFFGIIDLEGDGAKSEDELQDFVAIEALERRRSAALAVAADPKGSAGKRKRAAVTEERKEEEDGEERVAKRRKQQPGAVLLDTGRIKTMVTATSLVNLRPMMYLSACMRWGAGPSMGVRRGACAVALLDESRLLVLGGNEGLSTVGTTEVLDFTVHPRRMAFQPGPRLSSQRRECAVIPLDRTRLLVVGGYDGAHFLNTTEIVDLVTLRVSPGPRMIHRRAAPAVAVFQGIGRILVVGGKNAFGCLETTEVLDIRAAALEFKPGPSLRMQRAGPTAAPLDGNRIMVLGGHDSSRTHNTTEVITVVDPGVRSPRLAVSPGPLLATPRSYFASVMLNAGNLHVIGGHDGYNYLDTTDVLNLSSMEFTTGPSMRKRRFMCAATAIAEDRVVVLGGTDVSIDHNSTEMLSLPTYSFMPAPWMTQC
mmetsp:Transcript_71385/g.204799  ORF Transcript_71385/g.204799 Transcript_71385/m.204799 type:complete len:477 (-) Transcript_71385:135-1565(-)